MCKVSVERGCRLGNFSRGGWYRKSTARDQSGLRMRDIAMSRPRFGYERIHVLLRREGWHVNLKRVHGLYCLEGLQVRMRVRRKKRMSLHRGPAPKPTAPGQRWSMDFVHDQLVNGQPFLRDECLNTHEFESLEKAKRINEAWRRDYNDHRLHGSLGKLTPSEYVKSNQVRLPEAARFWF
jgi:transposase InsO family protein